MTVTASSIINRVRNQLIDLGTFAAQRWTDTELLYWISDGQRTIIAAAPRASQKVAVMAYVAGTRQTIPSDGYMFLAAYRNMGTSGTTPGPALEQTNREMFNTQYPGWHSATQVVSPTALMFDPADPTAFYVSPPADGTGHLELSYAAAAPDLTAGTQNLVVQDIYATPLFDYTMYRAIQKDSDYVGGQTVANAYLQAFTGFIQGLLKDPITMATQTGKT